MIRLRVGVALIALVFAQPASAQIFDDFFGSPQPSLKPKVKKPKAVKPVQKPAAVKQPAPVQQPGPEAPTKTAKKKNKKPDSTAQTPEAAKPDDIKPDDIKKAKAKGKNAKPSDTELAKPDPAGTPGETAAPVAAKPVNPTKPATVNPLVAPAEPATAAVPTTPKAGDKAKAAKSPPAQDAVPQAPATETAARPSPQQAAFPMKPLPQTPAATPAVPESPVTAVAATPPAPPAAPSLATGTPAPIAPPAAAVAPAAPTPAPMPETAAVQPEATATPPAPAASPAPPAAAQPAPLPETAAIVPEALKSVPAPPQAMPQEAALPALAPLPETAAIAPQAPSQPIETPAAKIPQEPAPAAPPVPLPETAAVVPAPATPVLAPPPAPLPPEPAAAPAPPLSETAAIAPAIAAPESTAPAAAAPAPPVEMAPVEPPRTQTAALEPPGLPPKPNPPNCRNSGNFPGWLSEFRREAAAKGISQATLSDALDGMGLDQGIIGRDRGGQKVFTQSFLDFSSRLANPGRLRNSIAKVNKHKALFTRAEQEFGVPGAVIAAFWALESDFGSGMGNLPILKSLATLAYDCRRGEMFRHELFSALQLIDRGDMRPEEMIGSWAGEIGQTQFLPGHVVRYAVDYDGDGRKNLFRNEADIIGTTANFIRDLGWRAGEPWLQEVRITRDLPWQEADLAIKHPLTQWSEWGVVRADGSALPADGPPASLVLPMGRLGPAFFAYPNFDVYTKWNQSLVYALTAAHLATRITGAGPMSRGAPGIPMLDASQVKELQSLLNRNGWDVGEPDGKLGAGTRGAVKKAQIKLKMPADSYPTPELLAELRGQ